MNLRKGGRIEGQEKQEIMFQYKKIVVRWEN